MGIIWPSDHGDGDVWDALMDTAIRVVIDGHNHAAGSGAKVSISQLAFDADISFVDAGGGKHAITDLKAIDFFPVDPSTVTALAGALFLNSVDNNLYYRTTTGANVKFTDGATINVGAFTGGFGGDYTGVGALAIFDDASDAYWFQQQVGTLVRQYGKVRSSDLSLFEFKAVGVTPVPTQAVTLKSPAALAAGYALTFPGALPASQTLIAIDNTGALIFGGAAGAATLTANTSIVISGTGSYKHGTKTICRTVGVIDVASNTFVTPGVTLGINPGGNDAAIVALPELPTHYRIINVSVTFDSAASRNVCSGQVKKSGTGDPASAAYSNVGGAMINAGTAKLQVTGLNVQPGSGEKFFVGVFNSSGSVTPTVINVIVDYDIP